MSTDHAARTVEIQKGDAQSGHDGMMLIQKAAACRD
jgi:hypothetical protein